MPSPSPYETCEQCGFDAAEWNDLDTARTLDSAPALVRLWTDAMASGALNHRPDATTWSALEYVDHLRETLFAMRLLITLALESPGTDLGPTPDPAPPGPPRTLDPAITLDHFNAEAEALAIAVRGLAGERSEPAVVLAGEPHTIGWASRHAVHDLWHHLIDIAAIRVALGDATAQTSGAVAQLNVSGGGVPKLPVTQATIDRRGVVGDSQSARAHHGRPWQALCLWSEEVITTLRNEGHPIDAGSAGENITVRGLDWSALRAGTILEIGAVRCQLSAPAVPCSKNAQWFHDGDFGRILHDREPGMTRWYASVLRGGEIRPDDVVQVVS